MDSVQVHGLRTTFERAGSGPAVVFVHGYVGDGPSTWRAQLDSLSDEFDVIAWDLPGAGGSDDPPETFGMTGYADALAAFIAALGLERPHLVGLSFGGATLIELCRHRQHLASTLTLVGAYAGWAGSLPPPEVEHRLNQAIRLSELDPSELVETLLPTMFTPTVSPDVIEHFGEALEHVHPAGFRAMARAVTADLTDVLPSIRVPTLLLYGEHDTRAPEGVATELRDAISGAELVMLEGAGHVCSVDGSAGFNANLRRFLRQHAS